MSLISGSNAFNSFLLAEATYYRQQNILIELQSVFHLQNYTWAMAPPDFSGAVFTFARFQTIAQKSSLCDFHYIKGKFLHLAFFVTNDFSAADLVHVDFC